MGQPSVSLSNPVARSDPASHFRALKQPDVAPSDPKTIRRPAIHAISCICARKCTKRRNSMDAMGLLSRREQPQVSDLVFYKLIRVWESNVRDESILFRQKVRFGCTNGRFSMDNGHAAALQSRCSRSAATPPPLQPFSRNAVPQPHSRPSHDAPLNRCTTARPRRVVKNSRTNRLKRLTVLNRPGIKLPEGNFHMKHLHLLRKQPSTREAYHPNTAVSRA